MRITRRTWLAASGLGFCGLTLPAAPPETPLRTARATEEGVSKTPETTVTFELITGATAAAEHAQAWGQRLQALEVTLQTRQAVTGDKPQIKEQQFGRTRRVTVTAVLDRNGRILCSDRGFTLAESEKLAAWIRELKIYGAQGAPHGKPLFGLDESQFKAVFQALSTKVVVETQGLPFASTLEKLPLPDKFPLRLTAAAQRAAAAFGADKLTRQDFNDLSTGTALAATLGEFGLAFRPLRMPSGTIELAVAPRDEDTDHWPLGWPLNPDKPQGQLAPNLFKMLPVQLDDLPLNDVLTAAQQATETPIVIDYHTLDRQGIILSELRVTVPPRKTTWGLLLKQITFPHKLGRRIVADEAHRVFVVITTLKESLKDNPAVKKAGA